MIRTFRSAAWLPLVAAIVSTGCAAPVASGPALIGSQWQLVGFVPSDGQGLVTVSDPSRYTLGIEGGGKAFLRLDCNRGSVTWTGAGDTSAGPLGFGPVASTRMLCPEPSLGARLAADLPLVRSFAIVDGRLVMMMGANVGELHWAPAPAPAPK